MVVSTITTQPDPAKSTTRHEQVGVYHSAPGEEGVAQSQLFSVN